MIRMWLLAAVLALMTVAAGAQDWSVYRSELGRYRVDMPGPVKLGTVPVPTDDEPLKAYHASATWKGTTYMVMYGDVPREALAGQTPKQLLDNAVKSASANHLLFSDKAITLGDHPGRDFAFQRANKVFIVNRTVLVGTRVYQVMVSTYGTDATRPDIRRFIASFSLL